MYPFYGIYFLNKIKLLIIQNMLYDVSMFLGH